MTFIEDKMEKILSGLNVSYIREYSFGFNTVDFYLPNHKIVIEADGEIYHKNKWKSEQRDKAIKRQSDGKVRLILHFRGTAILKYPKNTRTVIRDAIRKSLNTGETK